MSGGSFQIRSFSQFRDNIFLNLCILHFQRYYIWLLGNLYFGRFRDRQLLAVSRTLLFIRTGLENFRSILVGSETVNFWQFPGLYCLPEWTWKIFILFWSVLRPSNFGSFQDPHSLHENCRFDK